MGRAAGATQQAGNAGWEGWGQGECKGMGNAGAIAQGRQRHSTRLQGSYKGRGRSQVGNGPWGRQAIQGAAQPPKGR